MTTERTRAAVYLRQSLDRDGKAVAVERQRQGCRTLARQRGWRIVTEHVDNDTSASSGRARPGYLAMLAGIERGEIDAVVAWAPDRLIRRPIELEKLIDLVEHRGLEIAAVTGSDVDLSTPYGRAVARIFVAIARQEVDQKSARQKAANLQRAEGGKPRNTRRPFGYAADGITVVEAEAAVYRQAVAAVLDGRTLASVCAELNAAGIRTSTGRPWSVTTLRRTLLNPRYCGRSAYKGRDLAAANWPALVDVDDHRSVVARLADPRRRTAHSTAHKYLLSGLVVCGRCGEPMFASPMGRPGGYWMVYRCRRAHLARRLDLVDEIVERTVLARLARQDAADLFARGADVARLAALTTRLREQLDELPVLFAEGAITATGLRDASARLRARLADVEREMAAADVAGPLAPLVSAADVAAAWAALPLRHRRAAVRALMTVTILPAGKGARFDPASVQIVWRQP